MGGPNGMGGNVCNEGAMRVMGWEDYVRGGSQKKDFYK